MPRERHLLNIAWVIPQVFKGSGGHGNIFRNVAHLSAFGHRSTIYCNDFDNRFDSDDALENYICEHFIDTKARAHRHWNLDACDVAVATHWSTAYAIREFTRCSKKIYFVQDYEPLFYPMSYDWLRAENTYRFGFSCITLGRWLTHLLREKYSADCDYFDFAVDRTAYFERSDLAPRRRIAFYGQPDKPRRCFELGVQALEIVHRHHPDVEIVLFGSSAKPTCFIRFPYSDLGVITPAECSDLYRSSQVGLIISASNPSLVPVEMMACGCAVVDLDRENNSFDYDDRSISLAEPTPDALAQAIIGLLQDDVARQLQVKCALEMVSTRDLESSARKMESLLLTGWITGHVSSNGRLRLNEFQGIADDEASLNSACVQTFVATDDNLCEIHLFFANPFDDNPQGAVICELWDTEGDELLAVVPIPVSEIGNWVWHLIKVPSQTSSKGRTYRLSLCLDGSTGSYPKALYTRKAVYAEGALFLANEKTTGCLTFKTYCGLQDSPRGRMDLLCSQVGVAPASPLALERIRGDNPADFVQDPSGGGSEAFVKIMETLRRLRAECISPRVASPYKLRDVATALAYRDAGILVRFGRLLILLEHCLVWGRVHFRQGGVKAVAQRLRRRLSVSAG